MNLIVHLRLLFFTSNTLDNKKHVNVKGFKAKIDNESAIYLVKIFDEKNIGENIIEMWSTQNKRSEFICENSSSIWGQDLNDLYFILDNKFSNNKKLSDATKALLDRLLLGNTRKK